MTDFLNTARGGWAVLSDIDWYGAMTAPAAPYVYAAMLAWVALRRVRAIREQRAQRQFRTHLAWVSHPVTRRSLGRP